MVPSPLTPIIPMKRHRPIPLLSPNEREISNKGCEGEPGCSWLGQEQTWRLDTLDKNLIYVSVCCLFRCAVVSLSLLRDGIIRLLSRKFEGTKPEICIARRQEMLCLYRQRTRTVNRVQR